MEVISDYGIPVSWDDKGMAWESPDPRRCDYVMALREAVMERCAALHRGVPRDVMRISPAKTVSRKAVDALVGAVADIAGGFVNLGFTEYKEDWSDFPRMWSYHDLVMEEECRLFRYAPYGSVCEGNGMWLRAIKNALDRLTVIPATDVYGKTLSRDGSKHDPPFGESIGTAMQQAFDTLKEERLNGRFPTSVHGWSGNTHWCCPKPDYEGNPEYNIDGYCGYASSRAYRITAVRNWLRDAEFDFLSAVIVTEPTGPVAYSQVLDRSQFDDGGSGYRRGLNWAKPVRVKDWTGTEIVIGDPDAIPQNELVPTSEFDDEGNATTRHSNKTGWVGRSFGFLDYGVRNGFRFRKEG